MMEIVYFAFLTKVSPMDRLTDRRTERQMGGWMDRWTDPLRANLKI